MNIQDRPPSATAEQIIAAFEQFKSVWRVCRELHAGSERVKRALDEAGIQHQANSEPIDPNSIPENYRKAIAEYQLGAKIPALRKRFGVSYDQLYRWMSRCGVERRVTVRRKLKDWHCWECGVEIPVGETFCCDQHRRDYGVAAIAPGFQPPAHHRTESKPCQSTK
jgi:hypothetical protein